MPAAASFEDLYQQATTCSSSYHHLPNHYVNMFLASDSVMQQQQQHQNSIKCPVNEQLPPPKSTLICDKDQRHAHQQTNIKSSNQTMVMLDDNSLQQQLNQSIKAPATYKRSFHPLNHKDLSHSTTKFSHIQETHPNQDKCDHYQNQYHYYDDDDVDVDDYQDSDLFDWQPHSYGSSTSFSKTSAGFDIFNLDNVMILHDDIYADDSDESQPPHFLTTTTTATTCNATTKTTLSQQQLQPEMTTYNNTMQHYLTLEELKSARNSCWLCGCNWQQDHVSLDCPECDGYALTRPCPNCDGKCKQVWMRNITNTHDRHKASWLGQCALNTNANANNKATDSCSQQSTPVHSSQVDNMSAGHRQGHHITQGPTMTQAGATTALQIAANATATATPTTTTTLTAARTSQPVAVKSKGLSSVVVQPSSSSCCSSQPSSAASSDSE